MVFEAFNSAARKAVVTAQTECRIALRSYIGTEHLLLGCVLEADSIPAQVMDQRGISPEDIRRTADGILGPGWETPDGHIPFAPKASEALRRARSEALRLGVNEVGPEHLMLAVLNVQPSFAVQILEKLGLDAEDIKRQIARHAGYGSPEAVTPSKNAIMRMIGGMLFSGHLSVADDLPDDEAALIAACLKTFTG